jgi:hypothetical protein
MAGGLASCKKHPVVAGLVPAKGGTRRDEKLKIPPLKIRGARGVMTL